jgi:RNA polymerase sigma factor (sigma-70 family)
VSAGEDVGSLLGRHRDAVRSLVGREAAGLLRYETAEDLVQAVSLRALEGAAGFEYRGEAAFLAWLRTVARSCLSDRRQYWAARKRQCRRLLRYTAGVPDGLDSAPEPASPGAGPSTVAHRRELVQKVMKTLDLMLPRDRDLLLMTAEGLSVAEQAERLGVSYDAAERARLRALERFRKVFPLVSRAE